MKDGDGLLIVWVIVNTLWDVLVWGFTAYVIFWRGRSAWWILLAIALSYSGGLIDSLRKRFGLPVKEAA